MLAAALVMSLSISIGDEVTEFDQFGAFGWRDVSLLILRKHGEQKERHVARAEEMDHAVSAAFACAGPGEAHLPQSASEADACLRIGRQRRDQSAFSSSVVPVERDRRINSGVSTTVSIDIALSKCMRQCRSPNLNSRSTFHPSGCIGNLVDEALLTRLLESGTSPCRISCGKRNRTIFQILQLPNCWQIVGIRRCPTFISAIKTEL